MRKALGGVVSLEVLRGCLVGCDERDLFERCLQRGIKKWVFHVTFPSDPLSNERLGITIDSLNFSPFTIINLFLLPLVMQFSFADFQMIPSICMYASLNASQCGAIHQLCTRKVGYFKNQNTGGIRPLYFHSALRNRSRGSTSLNKHRNSGAEVVAVVTV